MESARACSDATGLRPRRGRASVDLRRMGRDQRGWEVRTRVRVSADAREGGKGSELIFGSIKWLSSSDSVGGEGKELRTVLVLGASLLPSVSVWISVSMSNSVA